MKRRALIALAGLCVAIPAWAADEGGETFLGLPTLFWKVANFFAFFGFLFLLLARPLSKFFHSRRAQITAQIEEA